MSITTRPPRVNVLELLPELEGKETTSVRLHPRRKTVADPAASKMGGQFLWPADEPWPYCKDVERADWMDEEDFPDEDEEIPHVRVLQLRKDEFPEMEFYPGTDIFQLLWCPVLIENARQLVTPFVYWRNSEDVNEVMAVQPALGKMQKYMGLVGVNDCELNPECITEFPSIYDVGVSAESTLSEWGETEEGGQFIDDTIEDGATLYEWELSAAAGCKVGGNIHWVQYPEIPDCNCGTKMEFLLTLTCREFDGGTWQRWAPTEVGDDIWDWEFEERMEVQCPPFEDEFDGVYHLFICRKCEHWPVKPVFQR